VFTNPGKATCNPVLISGGNRDWCVLASTVQDIAANHGNANQSRYENWKTLSNIPWHITSLL